VERTHHQLVKVKSFAYFLVARISVCPVLMRIERRDHQAAPLLCPWRVAKFSVTRGQGPTEKQAFARDAFRASAAHRGANQGSVLSGSRASFEIAPLQLSMQTQPALTSVRSRRTGRLGQHQAEWVHTIGFAAMRDVSRAKPGWASAGSVATRGQGR